MKKGICAVIICLFFILPKPCVAAEDEQTQKDDFAIELLYRHFESHYTPKDMLRELPKAKALGLPASLRLA